MKNYFKKLIIMFVMALTLSLGFCVSAFANDSCEIGTINYNASKGSQIEHPELGWRRFDDINSKINYSDDWTAKNVYETLHYNNTFSTSNIFSSTMKFKFYGSKLRIIASINSNREKNAIVTIDGISSNYSDYASTDNYKIIVYENLNLISGLHEVTIKKGTNDNSYINIDAIDTDGYLAYNNESITLDNQTMNLTVNDSEQLTATTTPAGLDVEWSSSDSSIATVDQTGKVTAIAVGTATITAQINGSDTKATCIVTVTTGTIDPPPVEPEEPVGDGSLFIELVDGNIKSYNVTATDITNFINWYNNRDNDDSQPPYYKFTKGTYKDYVIHDKIDWFEVR